MAIKDNLTKEFLAGINDVENLLKPLHFYLYSFEEKGYAYFVKYKRRDIIIEFLFGPSDWDVEMIVYSNKGKFAFKDLLQIPDITSWVNKNRYKQENERNIKAELFWFVELLRFSLPFIS